MANDPKAGKSLRELYPKGVVLSGGDADKYVTWEKVGTTVEGRFLRVRDGGEKGQFLDLDTGEAVVTVAAPARLAQAVEGVKVGTMLAIRFSGERAPTKAGQSGVKVFEVVAL